MENKEITISQIINREYSISGISAIDLMEIYFNFKIETSYDSPNIGVKYKYTWKGPDISYSRESFITHDHTSNLFKILLAAKEEVSRLVRLKKDLDLLQQSKIYYSGV